MNVCSVCKDVVINAHTHRLVKYTARCYPDGLVLVSPAGSHPAILALQDIDHLDEERIERLLALA